MKSLISIFLSFFCLCLHAQSSFSDAPSGKQGDFPANWDLVRGSAEIASLNGESIIYLSNKAIIKPKIEGNNYLSNSFTLEFDAFYDELSKIAIHQYYEVRFWEGDSYYVPNKSSDFFNPLYTYCHGGKIDGRLNGSKVKYDGYKQSMNSAKNEWRHIIISYNNGTFKLSIDGFQAINIPNLPFSPQMLSIGAFSNEYGDFVRAIKNIQITGIKFTNSNNNSQVQGTRIVLVVDQTTKQVKT